MLEHGAPIENYWFFEPRHGPVKRFVEAGLRARDVRRALEAGIDAPEAIIAYCKETGEPNSEDGPGCSRARIAPSRRGLLT